MLRLSSSNHLDVCPGKYVNMRMIPSNLHIANNGLYPKLLNNSVLK